MTLVVRRLSTTSGSCALSKTICPAWEPSREYLERLNPSTVNRSHPLGCPPPAGRRPRVVSVAMQALHGLGVAEPARKWPRKGRWNEDGIPVVVLAKEALILGEESAVQAHFKTRYAELRSALPAFKVLGTSVCESDSRQ